MGALCSATANEPTVGCNEWGIPVTVKNASAQRERLALTLGQP